ncbi:MAG: DegQ family serine endoprotease [Proteobacteria bacterium]|nr:DegQ family serine endoprotease [Pseudomonadota bacterium]
MNYVEYPEQPAVLTNRAVKVKAIAAVAMLLTGISVGILSLSVEAKTTPSASAGIANININDGFSHLVKAVKPAVVNISTISHAKPSSGNTPHFGNRNAPELEDFMKRFFGEEFFGEQFGGREGAPRTRETRALGSGFIVSEDGIVVTNNHVIDGADEIEVVFQDGKRYPATIKGSDQKTDIAVLKIDTDRPLPYVSFGDSDTAEVGDWVLAIGNPFGLGGTVTVGIVSARGRDIQSGPYDDFIQIDAPINRGNSGGPLFNTRGEVIGVNSAIFSPTGGSVGIGFSIPSAFVQNIVDQINDTGTVERGWLGVQIQTVTDDIAEGLGLDEAYGALVSQVVEDSPAMRAGLQAGDVVISYDNKRVDKMRDLPRLVANTTANSEITLVIWRNESKLEVSAVISKTDAADEQTAAKNESSQSEESLGLVLSPLNDELRKQYSVKEDTQGVIITDIDPASEAAGRGVRVGDVIQKIGRTTVSTVDEVDQAIKLALNGDKASLLLLIEREGHVLFVAIPVE